MSRHGNEASQVPYAYATGDLLKERHTYFYSGYGGRLFLKGWRADRDAARGAFGATAPPPPRPPSSPISAGPVETAPLLEQVLESVQRGAADTPEARRALSNLVKKFEVTKRIHRAYDERFRAVDRFDHENLGLYLRLAEVFEAAHAATGELPYLNALLKCLDTLCALRGGGLSEADRRRLSWLIERERGHVHALAASLARP